MISINSVCKKAVKANNNNILLKNITDYTVNNATNKAAIEELDKIHQNVFELIQCVLITVINIDKPTVEKLIDVKKMFHQKIDYWFHNFKYIEAIEKKTIILNDNHSEEDHKDKKQKINERKVVTIYKKSKKKQTAILNRKTKNEAPMLVPEVKNEEQNITDAKQKEHYLQIIQNKNHFVLGETSKPSKLFKFNIVYKHLRCVSDIIKIREGSICNFAECVCLVPHKVGEDKCTLNHIRNIELKSICTATWCNNASFTYKPLHIHYKISKNPCCTSSSIPPKIVNNGVRKYIKMLLDQTLLDIDFRDVKKYTQYTIINIDGQFVGYI